MATTVKTLTEVYQEIATDAVLIQKVTMNKNVLLTYDTALPAPTDEGVKITSGDIFSYPAPTGSIYARAVSGTAVIKVLTA